jgi:hypothetical protein
MNRLTVSIVALTVAVGSTALMAQRSAATVKLATRRGDANLTKPVRSEPYAAGRPVVGAIANLQDNARTDDGFLISAFSVYGWQDGQAIRVVVLAAIRPEGEQDRSADLDAPQPRRFREIARYTMAPGDTRLVTEMAALGAEPMTVAVRRGR